MRCQLGRQQVLRRWPQLAALDSLRHVAEAAIVSLCAAHPLIEYAQRHDAQPPLDQLADHLVDHAMSMLDALDRYRALIQDRDRLHRGLQSQAESIDDLPF